MSQCQGSPVCQVSFAGSILLSTLHRLRRVHSAEDYAKALEKDKSASKSRRKSYLHDGGSRPGTPTSVYSPETGFIPASFTAPTASYQPYMNGAHLESRPGTPSEHPAQAGELPFFSSSLVA